MTEKNKEIKNIICRCEEVTEEEVSEAARAGARTVDDVKRETRAGMGLCQSKTCYLNVARILSEELGISMKNIKPMKIRIPVRPISANFLSDD
jgi:NAD(P)H-nitrite reductase large subunit